MKDNASHSWGCGCPDCQTDMTTYEKLQKPKREKSAKTIKEVGKLPCIITRRFGVEVHHVKTKKSGGPDAKWNLCPLVTEKHRRCHDIGTRRFADEEPRFKLWLLAHGWRFDEVLNKWRHNETTA